jgi:hypothetical protein
MPTTATLAPPVTFSHSGGCPSHFVNQNKTVHNFAPYRARINAAQLVVCFLSGAGGTPWRLRMLPTV